MTKPRFIALTPAQLRELSAAARADAPGLPWVEFDGQTAWVEPDQWRAWRETQTTSAGEQQ